MTLEREQLREALETIAALHTPAECLRLARCQTGALAVLAVAGTPAEQLEALEILEKLSEETHALAAVARAGRGR